mmetsp:Transcript_44272/g.106648  ORF Transcript_44272/g.106648 Transcript_44272/m.106648 type:complete len:429 (-) Transcript_44272:63-1349(-)
MSFYTATETTETRDHSLSVIEILWMVILVIALMTPLVVFVTRQCRDARQRRRTGGSRRISSSDHNHAALRDFIVGSVLTRQEIEARKKYLQGNLKPHKVVVIVPTKRMSDRSSGDEEGHSETTTASPSTTDISKLPKGDLILSPPPPTPISDDAQDHHASDDDDNDNDDIDDDRPMCAICVTAYKPDDEICWSNNHQCHHCFHKECIQEWLLRHEECPCCRLPFLVMPPPKQHGKRRIKERRRIRRGNDENDDATDTSISHSGRSHDDDSSSPAERRNLRFSTDDEDAFQRMVASLRNSYRSLRPHNDRLEEDNGGGESSMSGRGHHRGRDDHDDDDDSDATLNTSNGRTEEIADQESDDQQRHHHPQQQQQPTENNIEVDNAFVDIELGMSEECSPDDDNNNDVGVVEEKGEDYDTHCLEEEQTQHC